MRRNLLILFMFFIFSTLFPNTKIDSLKNLLPQSSGNDKVHILNEISINYRKIDSNLSLEFAKLAVEESKQTQNHLLQLTSLRNLGSSYYLIGLIDSAITSYTNALNFQEINDKNELAKVNFNLSVSYMRKGFYNQADYHMNEALKEFTESSNEQGMADCYNSLGNLNDEKADLKTALIYYEKALNISKKINNKRMISRSLNNIGNIYFSTSKFDKAYEYYLEAQKMKEELNDQWGIANILGNLGNLCFSENNYKRALHFQMKSNEIKKELNDLPGLATNYGNIGTIYREMGNSKKALEYHLKELEIFQKIKLIEKIAIAYLHVANDYLSLEDYQEAEKNLKLSYEIAKKHSYLSVLVPLYKRFSELNERKGKYQISLNYLRKANTISDTLYSLEREKAIDEVQTRLETEKKEQQIVFLHKQQLLQEETFIKEQQISELKIRRQKNIIVFGVVLSILIVLLLIVILNRYFTKIKMNNILRQKNDEIKKAYDTIHESEKNLKELNQTKDKFFSIIAHDLRNPFQALINLSEIITRSYDTIPQETILKYNQLINTSSKHLAKLLENLLDWARSQTGRIEYKPQKIDLKQIADMNIALLKHSAKEKNIKLINELENPLFAYADENTISTVIRNLLSNAIKFTNENGFVKISEYSNDNNVEISISDNGVGIDEEIQNKIFRIDVHYSTSGTADEKGTGLGLILCKEFVEKNSGEIRVESKSGVGSNFIITLPGFEENDEAV